ncbi:MerR family DNA-binding transcriptional regulator [Streptomyces sp. NPDC059866]|uniref:MerR family DNA-binding transcriptional regulator n=1 Tax=Streptomyces sp. NPDC059866 TaxID=3346978 RepID=UPI00365ED7F5
MRRSDRTRGLQSQKHKRRETTCIVCASYERSVGSDRSDGDQTGAPHDGGLTTGEVARRLGVAPTTVRSWDRRYGLAPTGRTVAGTAAGPPSTWHGWSGCAPSQRGCPAARTDG